MTTDIAHYLSTRRINGFKKLLTENKTVLLTRGENESSRVVASGRGDPADRANSYTENSHSIAEAQISTRQLVQINRALQRISEGNFGYCDSCSEEIGLKRLEAKPTATECIECQTSKERKAQMHK